MFHTSKQIFVEEKSSLAVLRKKTGYTISNCKKALQLHDNNIGAAEKWLQEQAQTLGWKKATKLEGRQTSQGLIGVTVKDSCAAMVELNCETDFVARNAEFKNVVQIAANMCLDSIKQYKTDSQVTKVCFSSEQLQDLKTNDGKKLSDILALLIGTVGENAVFKRAFCYRTGKGIHLSAYAHPSGDQLNNTQLGKFGGILAFKQNESKEIDLNLIGKELCQHVVGMNPQIVGTTEDSDDKNENSLIHQEFLLDDTITVKDYLEENGVEVLDFKRFQCGEIVMESGDQPLDLVETCQ